MIFVIFTIPHDSTELKTFLNSTDALEWIGSQIDAYDFLGVDKNSFTIIEGEQKFLKPVDVVKRWALD